MRWRRQQQQQQRRRRHLGEAHPSRRHDENKAQQSGRETKKYTYLWGACNSRVVTGHRAGLGLCLAVQGKKCRSGSQARSSPSVSLSQARVLAGNLNRRNSCCGTLGGVAAVDKLAMMCCVSGRGLGWICARAPSSRPLASAEPASPYPTLKLVGTLQRCHSLCPPWSLLPEQTALLRPTVARNYTRTPSSPRTHHV
jgi:hypothetical protein